MEREYDNLTPAQKSKLTRRHNKAWEERNLKMKDVLYHLYITKRKEAEALYPTESIYEEASVKIEALKEQIKQIETERNAKVSEMRNLQNNHTKAEFEAYNQESSREWAEYRATQEGITEAFWAEIEANA